MLAALIISLSLCIGLLAYASFSIGSGLYLRALCRGDKRRADIALTFDDGPHPQRTPEVLDILKEYGVKAAFFVKGSLVDKYPEIARRIVEEGHLVGNHTYSHRGTFPLGNLRTTEEEIRRCSEAIEKATGERTLLFRPPFGVTNPTIAKAVRKQGLYTCGWSIRSLDTMDRPREKVLKRVTKRLHNGAVILLHDDRDGAAGLVRDIIEEATGRGYSFVRLDSFIQE